jgi:hypothetical protein
LINPGEFYYYRIAAVNATGASDWTSGSTNTLAVNVFLSSGYASGTGNNPDNNYWGIRYFNNLANAISNSAPNSTITIKAYNGSTSYTTSSINTTNNRFIIDDADLIVTLPIISRGLIQAISSGSLVLTPTQNVELVFPLSDGTNDETVKITCLNLPASNISIKISDNQVIPGGIISPMDIWLISGETNLNATIKFRIDKAAISPQIISNGSNLRYYNGSRYVPSNQANVTIVDNGTYYEITVTGINQF